LRLIILTQYYPPETGAPQLRLSDLSKRFQKMGVEVIVHTALPNYPSMKVHEGYSRKWYVQEEVDGIKIQRSWIFVKQQMSFFVRLLSYFSFVFSSLINGLFRLPKSDFLLCESPPLFLGISAYLLSRFKGATLIFNVSDLWPESAEKLGLVEKGFALRLSYKLERFLYKKSALVTGQTQGIVNNISDRFPEKRVFWFPNGVSPEIFESQTYENDWRGKNGFTQNDFIVFYGGVIGYAQGLDVVLDAAKELTEYSNRRVKFCLVGNGPEKKRLVERKQNETVENVHFFDSMPRNELLNFLKNSDTCIVPLKRLELFKGAIPSKIFEACASEKPILLGVEGEARELFINQATAGLFYEPESSNQLVENIKYLIDNPTLSQQMGENGRRFVLEKFNRERIAENIFQELKYLQEV